MVMGNRGKGDRFDGNIDINFKTILGNRVCTKLFYLGKTEEHANTFKSDKVKAYN